MVAAVNGDGGAAAGGIKINGIDSESHPTPDIKRVKELLSPSFLKATHVSFIVYDILLIVVPSCSCSHSLEAF